MNTTEALIQALIADGWTRPGEHRAAGAGEPGPELTSRDGLLTTSVLAAQEGCSLLLTAKTVRRPETRRHGWQAQLDAVPLPVALAAITAAGEDPAVSPGPSTEVLLAAAGWHEQPDDEPDDEDGDGEGVFEFYNSLDGGPLYRAWASPDGTGHVEWFGPDNDPAFWSIKRATSERGNWARLTHHAPAAVIAALALSD